MDTVPLPSLYRGKGRKPPPTRDIIICLILKIYYKISYRDLIGELRKYKNELGLDKILHFNTESIFASDATGFGTDRKSELNKRVVRVVVFKFQSKVFIHLDGNLQAMKPKICCYMDRDCTPECVAYSAISELSESAKQMGMNGMHCMRLILDLTDLMGRMDSEDFDEEDEDTF